MEIKISGRTKVKSFYKEFIQIYPYLYPSLRYPNGKPVEPDSTIANAKNHSLGGYVPAGSADLSMRGNLTVGSFEKRFEEAFSCKCEIYYRKNERWMRTGAKHNALTLSAANKLMQEEGCEIIKL